MQYRLLGLIGFVLLAGCAAEPMGNAGDPAASAQARGDWAGFVDATLEQWFRHDPSFAVYQGRHDLDGQLPDWSTAGLKRQADFLKDTIRRAKGFRRLNGAAALERDYLVKVAEGALFWLEDADRPRNNPVHYIGSLDPNVYVARAYADPAIRLRATISFLKNVPAAADQIRANLRSPLAAPHVEYGISAFDGFAAYYRGDLRRAFAGVGDPAMQRDLAQASEAAAGAMAGLAAWLKRERATATAGFALGPERLSRMLTATEGVDVSLDDLEAAGRADLARNQRALREACARFAPGAPLPDCMARVNAMKPDGGPVAGARRQLPELRAFLERADLVSIPGTETARVEESPPYNRQNSAYIDIPGPYERGLPSIYYISPPDPAWTPEVQAAYIPGEPDLLFTSVHEIWPGHFLQFLHSNRVRSKIGRVFVGYAFAEGWAHYAEELMW